MVLPNCSNLLEDAFADIVGVFHGNIFIDWLRAPNVWEDFDHKSTGRESDRGQGYGVDNGSSKAWLALRKERRQIVDNRWITGDSIKSKIILIKIVENGCGVGAEKIVAVRVGIEIRVVEDKEKERWWEVSESKSRRKGEEERRRLEWKQ